VLLLCILVPADLPPDSRSPYFGDMISLLVLVLVANAKAGCIKPIGGPLVPQSRVTAFLYIAEYLGCHALEIWQVIPRYCGEGVVLIVVPCVEPDEVLPKIIRRMRWRHLFFFRCHDVVSVML